MNFFTSLRTLTLALVLSIGISYAYAAWSPPSITPTGGNTDAPINVGTAPQLKDGGLGLGRSGFPALLDVVGKVTISGTVKVGNDAVATCAVASDAGVIKYTGTDLEGCVGSGASYGWKSLTASGGGGPQSITYDMTNCPSGCQFTVDPGVTLIDIIAAGGGGAGGAGGGSDKLQNGGGGGGGGAGQVATRLSYSVSTGQVFNISVGNGGIGNPGGGGNQFTGGGQPGQPGQPSSMTIPAGATVLSASNGSGGSGGVYSSGAEVGSPGADCLPYGTSGPGGGGINDPGKPAVGSCAGGGGGGGGNTSSNTQGAGGGNGGAGFVTISW